jgi:hypothetical protein
MALRLGILIFLLALLAPATVQVFSERAQISSAEKRSLAPPPVWPKAWSEWGALPGAADRFVRDHFGLREPLATGWSLLKYGLRYTPGVAVGRDGWLYYPRHWDTRYGGRDCGLLAEEVRAFAGRLERLAARAPLVLAIAPDKETVYPEYTGMHGASCDLLPVLTSALEGKRGVRTLDLLTPLRAWKAKEQVYFRTDSHWNDVGGWRIARVLLEGTCPAGASCAALPEPVLSTRTYSGDLAGLLGLALVLTEQYTTVEVPAAPKTSERTLYVVGDSFAKSVVRFLEADTSLAKVTFRDHAEGRVDFNAILAAKPDALLIVIVERYLYDRDVMRSFAAGL